MGWTNLTYSWKGVIVGGVTALISSFVLAIYLFFSMGRVFNMGFLNLVVSFAIIKLAWGFIFGYIIGSFFNDM